MKLYENNIQLIDYICKVISSYIIYIHYTRTT